MTDLTIAICTFNGEFRLPKVFDCLALQTNIHNISWEIVVVDNASRDGTADVVQRYQASWKANCRIRYVFEPQQGAAFARQKAIQEARGNLVAFLDDDNLPMPNWISSAYEFALEHPSAGAFGGQIYGKFEVPFPAEFKKIAGFLAIVDRGQVAHQYLLEKRMLPPGAGLVVRRQAWVENVPRKPLLKGRTQKLLMAGEDYEVVVYIQRAGWEVWHNPLMEMNHDISGHRLEEGYLLKLAWGTGLTRHPIRMIRYGFWQGLLLTPAHIINDLLKVVSFPMQEAYKSRTLFLRKFEIAYRLGTLASPLHLLKTQICSLWTGA